jgi:tetratricopeptide (TPR) repeat protein
MLTAICSKTQIALKFAHDIKSRLSVFWIRGDKFTNFAADYATVSTHLDPSPELDLETSGTDPTKKLSKTLRKLQGTAKNWLLILDNADDLDQFRDRSSQAMCIADFLPRSGRLLITTRDERFVGAVSKAQDAQRVLPMDADEAQDLLLSSIPSDLVSVSHHATRRAVTELLDELGNLPLAIAQAAANIHDRRSNLIDYVILYREKKRRMALMREPAWDFQDPNSSSRSIHITWEISFEYLKNKSPLSALCLSYLGCFHCQRIPKFLILRLPEFRSIEPDEFQQVMKQLLRLALVDCIEDSGEVVEYGVHPLVHERVISRLPAEEATQYLSTCSNILADYFPFLLDVQDSSSDAQVARYLVAHALRQIEIGEELSFSSKAIAELIQCVASYVSAIGMAKYGVHLATKAMDMAPLVWNRQSPSILYVMKSFCRALNNAAMYKEAEEQCRVALDSGLDMAKVQLSEDEVEEERAALENELASALLGLSKYDELVILRERQLQNKSILGVPSKEVVLKHNLAHALHHTGQNESAKQINHELLAWSDTVEGKEAISPSLRLIMMNLRLRILIATDFRSSRLDKPVQEDLLKSREFIYQQSRELGGITDINTWKAVNNLLGQLILLHKLDEAKGVLQEFLYACCSTTLKIEGQFAETFSFTYGHCVVLIWCLDSCGRPGEAHQLQELLDDCIEHVGIDISDISFSGQSDAMNTCGANLQQRGRFVEAETWHRKALEIHDTQPPEDKSHLASEQVSLVDVIHYNIMLAVARQGRVAEAMAFREQYMEEVSRAEAVYGHLQERLERDENDKRIYDEAKSGLRQGTIARGDAWWTDNQRALDRAELRYDDLAQDAASEEPLTMVMTNEGKVHRFRRWLFPATGPHDGRPGRTATSSGQAGTGKKTRHRPRP